MGLVHDALLLKYLTSPKSLFLFTSFANERIEWLVLTKKAERLMVTKMLKIWMMERWDGT